MAERSVLDVLTRRSAATIADLACELAIPSSTAVGAVSRLFERGLLYRRELEQVRRGRPSYQYGLRLARPLVAFQFDGTRLDGAIFGQAQALLALETMHVPAVTHLSEAAALLNELMGVLLSRASLRGADLLGAAVCINAIRIKGKTLSSSVLPWVDDTAERVFTAALDLPVRLVGAPHLAAELALLEQAPGSMAYLHVGDGVSGHFCAQGKPYHGASDRAGELGHISVDQTGPLCGCGRRGCLEALVSGPAIAQRLHAAAKDEQSPDWLKRAASHRSARVLVEQLWQAWEDGDAAARELMDPVLDRLGWGLGLLINILDPELVIAGGYVLEHHEPWRDAMMQRARPWVLQGDSWSASVAPSQATAEDLLRVIAARYAISLTAMEHAAR
ncbi:MAG: ROK family transcriptional regulator [Phycisphaeraceae bacterium]